MSEIPLLETDCKISAIARDAGFSTTSYYNKSFVNWFGHTSQTAFSNANSVFSYMAQLGFPDRFPLARSGTRLFSTEPQSQMRTEDVTETMDIRSSISGAGIHITRIQR